MAAWQSSLTKACKRYQGKEEKLQPGKFHFVWLAAKGINLDFVFFNRLLCFFHVFVSNSATVCRVRVQPAKICQKLLLKTCYTHSQN